MKIECPFCKQHYEIEEEFINIVIECQKCKEKFHAQPLSADKTIIQPPKIKLTPVFLHKSPNNLSEHNKTDENLFNSTEDEFVLKGLKNLKIITLLFFFTMFASLSVTALICFNKKLSEIGIGFLFVAILVLYIYFIINTALSWFRGMYRHIMWFSLSQITPNVKLEKTTKGENNDW